MQRDRRKPLHPLVFIGPALALLAIASALYQRHNAPGEEPAPVIRPTPTPFPKSHLLKEPLPPRQAAPALRAIVRGPAPYFQVRALPDGFEASDLNDAGIIVGSVVVKQGETLADIETAAAFWQRGKVTRLSGNGAPRCYARAISDSGMIAGEVGTWSELPGGDSGSDAAIWQVAKPGDYLHCLKPVSAVSHPALNIVRINRWGQFIGNAGSGSTFDMIPLEEASAQYDIQNIGMSHLSFFQDGTHTRILNTDDVYGLNDLGQVVGYEDLQYTEDTSGSTGVISWSYRQLSQRAMLYQEARVTTLWEDPKTAVAYAISNRQHVVGVQGIYPVLWNGGSVLYLPLLPGTTSGVPQDINDGDQVVGHCGKDNLQRATLWQNGSAWNLNQRLLRAHNLVLTKSLRINNRGQILACDDDRRWYLLTPTH